MEPRIFLVNPARKKDVGFSFIVPRWLVVLAQATPRKFGDPVLIDETIQAFDPGMVRPGDVVGIGVTTLNCLPGYAAVREAKRRGATVVVGGIHATILPEEPLEMGADAVVTGGGDVIWQKVLEDALTGKLQKRYNGGKVPGDLLIPGRWDLLDTRRYMCPSVQTTAGCPENCSFCSVWITEGRVPRQRPTDRIIAEVNELYRIGFRVVIFADDNFNPATKGRIARETSPSVRRMLENNREQRLQFFADYDKGVPNKPFGFTQMTSEIVSDPEYVSAAHDLTRVRAALVGVESFTDEGLRDVRKTWNKKGEEMLEVIRAIEAAGICVLASVIFGLPSDTPETARTMRDFVQRSGTTAAQFPLYSPFLGTVDTTEMLRDRAMRFLPKATSSESPAPYRAKHTIQVTGGPDYRFWLDQELPRVVTKHPTMSTEDLLREIGKSWDSFYSLPATAKRAWLKRKWGLKEKICFFLLEQGFRKLYGGYGISADSVSDKKMSKIAHSSLKLAIGVYNIFFRKPVRELPQKPSPPPPPGVQQGVLAAH
ncbi:MAG: B12-binding domain-containing radical SAM protein [Candidatus Acidiferrales bacterium]